MRDPHFSEPLALGRKPELLVETDNALPRMENKFADAFFPRRRYGKPHQLRPDALSLILRIDRKLPAFPNTLRQPPRPHEQSADDLRVDHTNQMAVVFLLLEIGVAVAQPQRLAQDSAAKRGPPGHERIAVFDPERFHSGHSGGWISAR